MGRGVRVNTKNKVDADALLENVAVQAQTTQRNDMIRADELLSMEFEPLQFVVDGVIATGLTLLVAAPKIGKSWMALDLAYQVASGGKAFGAIPVQTRPVLYLALEDGQRRLNARMRKLGCRKTENLFFVTRTSDIDADLDDFMKVNAKQHPLVIVDTLQKYRETKPASRNDSAYERDYAIVGGLQRRVLEAEGSLLILHHDRKAGSGDFVESVSGTNGIAGSADTIITINRPRVAADAVLSVTSRDAAEGEYAVRFDDGRWILEGGNLEAAAQAVVQARAHARNGDRMNDVLDFVTKHPQGVQPFEVSEALGDISPNTATQCLIRLFKAGSITKLKRGVYAPIA